MKAKYQHIETKEFVLADQVTEDEVKKAIAEGTPIAEKRGLTPPTGVAHGALINIPAGAWRLYTVGGHPLNSCPSDSAFAAQYQEVGKKQPAAEKPVAAAEAK